MSNKGRSKIWRVITSSSVGTLIEWYDFYIFGSLAPILSQKFFPQDNPTIAFLNTLLTFAAGFIVRPFGALVFGRLGDLVGRKYTFLVTLILMGSSTFFIGLVPGYDTIGVAAPLLVLLLRVLQGLALGGEYGGAATYVAEHAPDAKRGFYTSWIQTTATAGLLMSLVVILLTRTTLGEEGFVDWGWRVPFLLSSLLVGVSIFIRLRMSESPLFAKIKSEGKTSANPLKESFANKSNLKMVLLVLFGATMGQGVVWYTGQFYAMSFIQNTCKIDAVQSSYLMATALILGTPFFVIFGGLSDRIGRKWIIMLGLFLAVVTYRPIYSAIYATTDISKRLEATGGAEIEKTFEVGEHPKETITELRRFTDGTLKKRTITTAMSSAEEPKIVEAVTLNNSDYWRIVLLVFIQMIYVAMVYGPMAAFLVELFPTRIRYTSMSLPYHIGNGIFGGLTPAIATRFFEASKSPEHPAGDPTSGLTYVILIAGLCFIIGSIYLSNKAPRHLEDNS